MIKRIITVSVVALILFGGAFILSVSARPRMINNIVIKPCADPMVHIRIENGAVIQLRPFDNIIEGIKERDNNGNILPYWADFNKRTLYIGIDSWKDSDWELGAYVVLSIHYETGQPVINPFNIGLLEQWIITDDECKIGYGSWTNALINTYAEWYRTGQYPTQNELRKKIGVLR